MDQYSTEVGLHGEGTRKLNRSAVMSGAFQLG